MREAWPHEIIIIVKAGEKWIKQELTSEEREQKKEWLGKCINSMLTIYWTVELDLRFCPQAIDGWMDLLMDGWMDGRRRKKDKVTNDKKMNVQSTREKLSV